MTSMKAIRIHTFGGPEVLKLEDVPLPQPGDDEILVRIRAASVNPVDFKIRKGGYPMVTPKDLPKTLGRDFSGTVESVGARVQGVNTGDAVFALLGRDRGAYAQYVIAKPTEFAAKPRDIDHVHAAAVPLAALTAWQGIFDQGKLTAGQKVLIHGGAGGVGHMAVQLAKAKGAWVAATCSGGDIDFVRGLGADKVIDYKTQRFEDEVSELDLVYDLIGGETQTRSFAVLKRGGALISTLKQPDAAKAAEKNLHVAHYMAEASATELAEVAGLINEGKVRAVVSRTFPLAEAAAAQTFLEKEHVRGKVVLTVE
jgi:NADPH:quinone reductase-like Zn-dependent oxidoreductase